MISTTKKDGAIGLLLSACLLEFGDRVRSCALLAHELELAAEVSENEFASAEMLLCAAALHTKIGARGRARRSLEDVKRHAPSVYDLMQGLRIVEKMMERAEDDAKEAM